ncbi:TPA: hypothetical protein ACHVKA_003550 [Yersinia enterocolitica]
MKKITEKQWKRDVLLSLKLRRFKRVGLNKNNQFHGHSWEYVRNWIDEQVKNGLQIEVIKKKKLRLILPEKMNFYHNYEKTIQHITAIRKLATTTISLSPTYKLGFVDFSKLKEISTSAALVLTAELSKWDDAIRQRLTPKLETWDATILKKFYDLGFFELFNKSKGLEIDNSSLIDSDVKFVKYLKGKCGDIEKTVVLKNEIIKVVGEKVSKWVILQGGLSEAITNVSHHAYPANLGFKDQDKNWYLTGSYNEKDKVLKVVFYDQGIGIPKSLPASQMWERIVQFISKFTNSDRKNDEVLLKAAVELDRTRTKESDRGKGLQDLLDFIKERGDGYLSIMSAKGLYKHEIKDGKTIIKTENFSMPVCGTLIIWSASL